MRKKDMYEGDQMIEKEVTEPEAAGTTDKELFKAPKKVRKPRTKKVKRGIDLVELKTSVCDLVDAAYELGQGSVTLTIKE